MEVALELARRAKDPQSLYTACAVAAHVLIELGEHERAVATAEVFLAGIADSPEIGFADTYLNILSWTLTEAGRGEECVRAGPLRACPGRDRDCVRSWRPGASRLCAEIGAFASERTVAPRPP
jgi:hypothetical protein